MRNTLATKNLKLVRFVLCKMGMANDEDLFQVGCIGLLKACDRYNPALGRFSTCAYPWIRGEILRYLRDKSSPLSGTRNLPKKPRIDSLDRAVGFDTGGTLLEVLPDQGAIDQAHWLEQQRLISLVQQLEEDEQALIEKRYWEGKSSNAIAQEIGVTGPTVRRRLRSVEQKLMQQMGVAA